MGRMMQAPTMIEPEFMAHQVDIPDTSVEEAETRASRLAQSIQALKTKHIDWTKLIPADAMPAPATQTVPWVPLTEFKYFTKLPFELRNMIYVIVIKDSSPRILAIQPQYREHPGLIQTWKESREACAKYYYYCASKQRCKLFRFFIDYQKDVLYLNHPFTLLGGKCQQSPLQSTHSIYPEFLELIETLAVNIREVRNLCGDHRGKNTIWFMLSKWCPNLKELRIVINNFPTNGLFLDFLTIKTTKQFAKMVHPSKKRAAEEVSESFTKAKTEGGLLTHLKVRLVLIDETAGKVKSKRERAAIAEAWKKANMKVNGISEVDRIAAELEGNGIAGDTGDCQREGNGKGLSDDVKKDKKVSEESKLPVKKKTSGNSRRARAKAKAKKSSAKTNTKSTGTANK